MNSGTLPKTVIEMFGVKYSIDIFRTFAFPKEDKFYKFRRYFDTVVVTEVVADE